MKREVKGTGKYEERGQGYREIWGARSRVPGDMNSDVKGTGSYEERGQGYREIGRERSRVPGDMKIEGTAALICTRDLNSPAQKRHSAKQHSGLES
jgi:hypothetical protein